MTDFYDECSLKAAGLSLYHTQELGTLVIGPDGKCICVKGEQCINTDKRGDQRCTLEELRRLDDWAYSRRAWQSGE